MIARRVATAALAVLVLAGVGGMILVWEAGNAGAMQWSGREPGDAALTAFALLQMSYSVGLPALAMTTAASAFALVVIGARVAAERWNEHESRAHESPDEPIAPAASSERGADHERARLDVEIGRHD